MTPKGKVLLGLSRLPRAFTALLLSFALCHESQARTQGEPAIVSENSPEYRVGNGDVLQISVWGESQLSERVMVRPDGKISLPLISDVKVGDMTVRDAGTLLTEKFSAFLKHPQITVLVAEVHSKLVYVTGEVQRPGAYPLLAPTNVVQLIARAGGVTPFAKTKKVCVLRKGSNTRLPVNYKALLEGHRTEQNVELASGDTVVIP